jgi:hypothetical protein
MLNFLLQNCKLTKNRTKKKRKNKKEFYFYFLIVEKSAIKLSAITYQSLRYRGKFNSRIPRPRHELLRYLEEITKPVINKQFPDPTEKCKEYNDSLDHTFKVTTKSVS